jgi:AraC family transcriptional regulator
MTYHQTAEPLSWLDPAAGSKPKISVTIRQELLDDVSRALAHDRTAAQAGIARLASILKGREVAPAAPTYTRGGFAPWQKRRVDAYLAEHLAESIPIKTLAQMVSLSESHFCRAFKQSFGRTPHAYLIGLRIERAKQMMMSTREPLSQIAFACGLADQSHLSRASLCRAASRYVASPARGREMKAPEHPGL